MSDRIKTKIGEELYNQIIEKGIKPAEFDLVDGWIPKQRFDEKNKEVKLLNEKIEQYTAKGVELDKLLKDNTDLKSQYETLNTKYLEEISCKDKEILNITKSSKVESKLKDAGAKFSDLLMPKIDMDKLTLDNGNLIGLDEVVTDLKSKYSDLFTTEVTNSTTQPSITTNNAINSAPADFNFEDFAKTLI